MKLFTKDIDKKLFAQFPKGGELANQKVIAKIFNPYGRGVWYLINSDPNDPDYIWAITDLFEVEVGSVSRKELESLRIKPFMLPLERDLYFDEKNALEVYEGASKGQRFANGGGIGFLPMELEEKINIIARWSMSSMREVIEYLNAMIDSGVTDEDLQPKPTKRTSFQVERAIDQKTKEIWKRIEPNYKGSLTGNRYYSLIRKMVETTTYSPTFLAQYKPFRKLQKDSYAEGGKLDESTKMVLSQNKAIAHHTEELKRALQKDPNVEPWVIGKVGRAETDISDVTHYLDGRSEYADGGRLSDANHLVGMAEEYAEVEYEKPVKKGQGTAKATKKGDILEYTEVTVFFKDGTTHLFHKEDFPKFFNMYAKGGFTPNIVSKNNRKFGTSMYYERFEGAIGSFAWMYEGKYNEGILYPLSDFDKKYYSHLKLKDGEVLLRYKTERMISSSGKYLIKMNIDKGLVYFLDDSNEDDDKNPTFDSRGTKLEYLAINETYFDLDMFKKGGLTFDEKVKAVEKSLMSREVPKKYRNSYGKTYNKAEAHESAQKIIGAQLKKYNKK